MTRGRRPVCGRRRSRGARDAGFTLLEMIVAVAILAALVAVIPRSFVAARANFERSEEWMRARLVAERVMNEELVGQSLKPGIRRGSIEGTAWSATLEQNGAFVSPDPEVERILLNVRVMVEVGGGEPVELSTMRIGLRE